MGLVKTLIEHLGIVDYNLQITVLHFIMLYMSTEIHNYFTMLNERRSGNPPTLTVVSGRMFFLLDM